MCVQQLYLYTILEFAFVVYITIVIVVAKVVQFRAAINLQDA